jgi:hypothetical protein
MRLGTWNVRNLYKAGSLVTVLEELSECKLDLVGVQEVGWEGSATKLIEEYKFICRKGNENHELHTGF